MFMERGAGAASAAKPRRGRPRLEHREDEVLAVAAAHFNSRGYAASTLEGIASELGITRPALYHYADSKEALLLKCYDWYYRRFNARLTEALQGAETGREKLERFFETYSEMICDDVSQCFLSSETHHLDADQLVRYRRGAQRVTGIVEQALAEGEKDGSIAACDRKTAVDALFGAFNSLPHAAKGEVASARSLGAGFLELFLTGLAPRDG